MRISRIYNNNVALTRDSYGQEAVVIGRGLAFGKRKGDLVDPSKVEQTFIPEHDISAERLSWSLSEIPPEILAIASELETKVRNTPDIKSRTPSSFLSQTTCTMLLRALAKDCRLIILSHQR